MKEQAIISTPFGKARLTVTDGNHIHMDANGFGDGFTVNSIHMQVSGHFGLNDGKWDHEKRNGGHCPYMYMSRGALQPDVSDSARKKLREQLPPVIQEWADAHPEVLAEATINAAKAEVEKKQTEVEEKESELINAKGLLEDLENKLRYLESQHVAESRV